ncbi:MAG: cation diffusion facilitator family transporter [Bacteroidota bacterium]
MRLQSRGPHDPDVSAASGDGVPDAVRQQRIAMGASLVVAFVMLGGKLAAYGVTSSTAILSDALESVVHLAATAVAGFSLWYAAQPPDRSHPYGHGKIAYVSSGLEGALILLAAVAIVWTATLDLVRGPEVERIGLGLLITAALALVNLVLGVALVRVGQRTNALVLVANGRHVLTDMVTSLGVLAGIGLVWATGVVWLDPVVALLVGANIVWTSGRLLRQAYGGLMETADPEATTRVQGVLDDAVAEGLIDGHHHVRHRRVNDQVWIEQHLLLPDALRLDEAHARATTVETRQRALFPESRVQITSHLEPTSHDHPEEAPHDDVVDFMAAEG